MSDGSQIAVEMQAVTAAAGELKNTLTRIVTSFASAMGAIEGFADKLKEAADASKETKGPLESMVESVASTSEAIAEFTGMIGEVGGIIQSGLTGALDASTKFSKDFAGQLEHLKLIVLNLSAEFGDALGPHIEQLSKYLSSLLGWIQRLDPETRKAAAGFLFYGTAVGVVGSAVSTTAGFVAQFAKSFNELVTPAIGLAGTGLQAFSKLSKGELPSIGGAFKGLGASVKASAEVLPNALSSLKGPMRAALTQVIESVRAVPGAVGRVFATVRQAPAAMVTGVRSLAGAARIAGSSLAAMASGALRSMTLLPAALGRVGAGAGVALKALPGAAAGAAKSLGGLALRAVSMAIMVPASLAQMAVASAASLGQVALSALAAAAPFLAAAAVIAALVLLAGTLYKAWNDSSTGFRDAAIGVWTSIQGVLAKIVEFFGKVFTGIGDFVMGAIRVVLDGVATMIRGLASMALPVARLLGMDKLVSQLEGLQAIDGDKLMSGLLDGQESRFTALKGALSSIWEGFKYGAAYAWDGVKQMGSDAAAALKGKFDIFNGPKGKLRKPLPEDGAGGASDGDGPGRPDMSGQPCPFEPLAPLAPAPPEVLIQEIDKPITEGIADAMKGSRSKLEARILEDVGSAFDKLGGIIKNAQEASGAGAMAVIASVVADLLIQSSTFGTLVEMVNGFLKFVADTLGTVLAPVLPLVAAVFNLVSPLLKALQPALSMFLSPLEAITPVIQILSVLMEGFAPVITILSQIFMALMMPLNLLAGPVMKVFFEAVRWLSVGILYVVKGVGFVWNGLVSFVQKVFNSLRDVPGIGDLFKDWAKQLNQIKVPMDQVDGAIQKLRDSSFEAAAADAAESAQSWASTEATREATEALSNVPEGFKIALARFSAQDAVDTSSAPGTLSSAPVVTPSIPPPVTPSSPVIASPAPAPAGGGGTVIIESLVIEETDDARETARSVLAEMKLEARRRRGTAEWLPSRY